MGTTGHPRSWSPTPLSGVGVPLCSRTAGPAAGIAPTLSRRDRGRGGDVGDPLNEQAETLAALRQVVDAAGPCMDRLPERLVERVTLDWLRELVGLPPGWGGALTASATFANLTGLALATHWWAQRTCRAQTTLGAATACSVRSPRGGRVPCRSGPRSPHMAARATETWWSDTAAWPHTSRRPLTRHPTWSAWPRSPQRGLLPLPPDRPVRTGTRRRQPPARRGAARRRSALRRHHCLRWTVALRPGDQQPRPPAVASSTTTKRPATRSATMRTTCPTITKNSATSVVD